MPCQAWVAVDKNLITKPRLSWNSIKAKLASQRDKEAVVFLPVNLGIEGPLLRLGGCQLLADQHLMAGACEGPASTAQESFTKPSYRTALLGRHINVGRRHRCRLASDNPPWTEPPAEAVARGLKASSAPERSVVCHFDLHHRPTATIRP